MITDFSITDAPAIAEALIPRTGAAGAAPNVMSETAIAANKAMINRSPGMAIGSSITASTVVSVRVARDENVTRAETRGTADATRVQRRLGRWRAVIGLPDITFRAFRRTRAS
jgi:hypothetical protein